MPEVSFQGLAYPDKLPQVRGEKGGEMSGYLAVKNWEKFQHYKDRQPPWIKLYYSLLDDFEFSQLSTVAKCYLVAIFLLASRTGNKIPDDKTWIKGRSGIKENPPIEELENAGFLIRINDLNDASKMLADCKQNATPSVSVSGIKLGIDLVLNSWNELAEKSGLPQVKQPETRRDTIRTRLSNQFWADNWKAAMDRIPSCPFLMGEGNRGWRADFDWFLQPKSVAKIIEGKYAEKGQPKQLTDQDYAGGF